MTQSSGLRYVPVDLGDLVIPLGQIKKVTTLSETQQRSTDAITRIYLEDGGEVFSTRSAERVCRAMWEAITTFARI